MTRIAEFDILIFVKSSCFFILSMMLFRFHDSSHESFNIEFISYRVPRLMSQVAG